MILFKETPLVNQSEEIDRRMFSQEYFILKESPVYPYGIVTLRPQ